jgi:heme O synthase-like polyprenyltransferase
VSAELRLNETSARTFSYLIPYLALLFAALLADHYLQ